jgi:hypothetical protein
MVALDWWHSAQLKHPWTRSLFMLASDPIEAWAICSASLPAVILASA